MKRPIKETNPEVKIPEPVVEKKDWEAIAREIWDDYDTLALFLESHFDQLKEQELFPFFEKVLRRRFKYFINSRGRTLTIEEYTKEEDRQRQLMGLLMRK